MTTVQMRGKGTITFPQSCETKYKLQEGEVFTIIDLGGGSFLLKPKVLEVDILSRRIAKSLKEDDFDIEEWLPIIREERKKDFSGKIRQRKALRKLIHAESEHLSRQQCFDRWDYFRNRRSSRFASTWRD